MDIRYVVLGTIFIILSLALVSGEVSISVNDGKKKVSVGSDFEIATDLISYNNIIYPDRTMLACPVYEITRQGQKSALKFCYLTEWETHEYNLTLETTGNFKIKKWKKKPKLATKSPSYPKVMAYYSDTFECHNETMYELVNETEIARNETVCEWVDWVPVKKLKDKYPVNLMEDVVIDPIVSACGTLSTPGYYQMNQSIMDAGSDCLKIVADNITLDCAGYIVDGDDTANTEGIYVSNPDVVNITITNCTISDFDVAIRLWEANNSFIYNNTILNANDEGMHIVGSSGNKIYNNSVNASAEGIYLVTGSSIAPENNTIENNTITASIGIYLSGYGTSAIARNQNNTVRNNTIIGTTYGLRMAFSLDSLIEKNNIAGATNGVYIFDVEDCIFKNNTIISTSGDALRLYTAEVNTPLGTFYENTTNNNFKDCSIISSAGVLYAGIDIGRWSPNNTFTNCSITSSLVDVWVDALGSPAKNNTFVNCSFSNENEIVTSGSELIRKWFVDVNVTNSTGSAVSGATVKGFAGGNSNSSDGTFTTPASGIVTASFTEYVNTSTTTYWTPTYILAYKNNLVGETKVGVWGNNNTNITLGTAISFVSPTYADGYHLNASNYIPINVTLNFTASECNATINSTNYALVKQNKTNFYANVSWGGSDGLVTYNVTCTSNLGGNQFTSSTRSLTINTSTAPSDTTPPTFGSCKLEVSGATYSNASTIAGVYGGNNGTLICSQNERGNMSLASTFGTNLFPVRNVQPLYTFKINITLAYPQDATRCYHNKISISDVAGNTVDSASTFTYCIQGTGGGGGGGGGAPVIPEAADNFQLFKHGDVCRNESFCYNSLTYDFTTGSWKPIPFRSCANTVTDPRDGIYTICSLVNKTSELDIEIIGYTVSGIGNTRDYIIPNQTTIILKGMECENIQISVKYPGGIDEVFSNTNQTPFIIRISGIQRTLDIPVGSMSPDCNIIEQVGRVEIFGVPWYAVFIALLVIVMFWVSIK